MLIAISAHDIDAAGTAVDATLPPAWLDAELDDATIRAKGPGRVSGRLSRSGNDIVVRARVLASLATPCARCLDPTTIDVDTELSLLLRPAPSAPRPGAARKVAAADDKTAKPKQPKAKPKEPKEPKAKPKDEEYEFSSAEADVDVYDGETVVLDPFVREAILLEVPNFPLCSEGCPGIRPADAAAAAKKAEAALPLDPRLAPLAALRATMGGLGPPKAPERAVVHKPLRAHAVAPRLKKKNKE